MCVIKIVQGDALALLNKIPSEFVHCVVTSPPYWGLRDYGTAKWEGGDPGCEHLSAMPSAEHEKNRQRAKEKGYEGHRGWEGRASRGDGRRECKCGARRIDSQLGLEPTFQEYIGRMVEVFREVRRVLRSDGTMFLNMGDSYNAHPSQRKTTDKIGLKQETNNGSNTTGSRYDNTLKPKDLCGIPWRLAFALQADGWYLRSDIIWAKPNPMPESVTDRPTKSHEYLFLLSKSERYYYDGDAIREPYNEASLSRYAYKFRGSTSPGRHKPDNKDERYKQQRDGETNALGRNARTVWTIATRPYKGAHFATFPPALVEPCIKAGAPAGSIVLDPFAGSGTVGMVAKQLGRHAILLELNSSYCEMAAQRCNILPSIIMREQKEQKSHALFT